MRTGLQKKGIVVLALFLLAGLAPLAQGSSIFEFDYSEFARIAILHEGRVKPLDTFAKTQLEIFNGRNKLPDATAVEWLAEALMNPERAYRREIFNVANPKVIDALELERRPKHRYSYEELSRALRTHFSTFHPLFIKAREELTLPQQQLLDLYSRMELFSAVSGSLSLMLPEFEIADEKLAETLGAQAGSRISYMDLRKKREALQTLVQGIFHREKGDLKDFTPDEKEILTLFHKFQEIEGDRGSQVFRVIPPQWEESKELWFSPWSITEAGHGSPKSAEFLRMWKELVAAYRDGDTGKWVKTSKQIREYSLEMAGPPVSSRLLNLEVSFNRSKPFVQSLILYLVALLLITTGFMFWPKKMYWGAWAALIAGFGFHAAGIFIRMMIMGRPPVSNLYESIVFVGFVSVLTGIVLEWRKQNGFGIVTGAFVGILLHFLGFKYDAGGDTMGMLAAVLNTKFWLTTHVITITIGYGCCLVGSVIGHIYLLQRILQPSREEHLVEVYKNMQGIGFVALFFSALGTILGGIWADQSWGRFWGWDPKENGALLIVLWLIWLIHGRLSGKIKDLEFAVGMVCTNIVVALAWFGVNLLNVGLHSYGFTGNVAANLIVFCGIELIFALGTFIIIKRREKPVRK